MNGIYGIVRPADVNIESDVEIFYTYRPTRSTIDSDFADGYHQLSATQCLKKQNSVDSAGSTSLLLGMYNLCLPLDKFNKKGIYTIVIRPKEYKVTLYDVGVLSVDTSAKGVVFTGLTSQFSDLTGYRLEYYSLTDSTEKTGEIRLITSCNYCEPAIGNIDGSYAKSNTYRLTNSNNSNMYFCTVSPSTSPSYNTNFAPYIGTKGQSVALINTKFNPLMIEIEMVENDAETLSWVIAGDQVRDRDHSLITTYNSEHEIYKQQEYYTLKTNLGEPMYDVKINKDNVDGSQAYENIITGTTTENER